MEYRILGKTGLKVSAVGFGGIPVQRISDEEASLVVNAALDRGINFFDTARGYTDSEVKLGRVLSKRRSEAVIATKSMARTRDEMAGEIRNSLENLGVDYIDLYQLHNVKDREAMEKAFGPGGALEALLEAKKEGLVKHVGITGHIKGYLLEALENSAIETVQFPFNAVESDGAESLLQRAREVNAGLIAMKPLAGGALLNAGLALKFILQQGFTTVIPGMDSVEQVEENSREAGEAPSLGEEERIILEEEAGKLGSVFCRRCEYCQPCPQGVDIPTVFLLHGYYTRYDLKDWAIQRYQGLPVKANECEECGECEEKCPYELPVRLLLAEAARDLEK